MNENGFTLIEILLVMALMALMAGLYVPYYSQSVSEKALQLAQKQVQNDFRLTQDYSFKIVKYNNSFPVGGYGIYFNKSNKYIIFADFNSNGVYDSASVPNEKYEEINLPQNVYNSEITRNSDSSSLSDINIIFQPPYGNVRFNDASNFSEKIIITLKNNNGQTKAVSIQGSGLVE